MKWKSWLLATRPKTLSAALVPILVASAFSYYHFQYSFFYSLLALLSTLFIQIACNLFNDAIDFKKGADGEDRIGPKRLTASGELSFRKVMSVAVLFLILASLCGIPLVLKGGLPIVVLGLCSLFFAYAYTGGPFPLAYLGIADVFVLIFFGFVAVGALSFIQIGRWMPESLVLGLQVGLLCNLMLAINNLRDHETDRLVGKKSLAVRFGPDFVRSEICVLFFVPFLLNLFWFFKGMYFTTFLNFLLFPFAVVLCLRIIQEKKLQKLNLYLGLCSAYYLLFGILLSTSLVIDRG